MRHTCYRILYVLLLGLVPGARVHAENSADEIKAVFVYNFSKFVEWPASAFPTPTSPFQVCIWGHSPLQEKLQLLDGRETQGRIIRVRNLGNAEGGQGCHILVLSEPDDTQHDQLLAELGKYAILTIGESADFVRHGGMINLFVTPEMLVQFSVNLEAAQRSGLKIGARMLKLARTPGQGGAP